MADSTFIIIDKHAFRCELISGFFSRWMDEKEVSIIQFGCVNELLDEKELVHEIGSNVAITLSIGGAPLSDTGVLKEIIEIKKIFGSCPLIIMADDTSDLQVRLASQIGINGLISTAMPPDEVVTTCDFVLRGGTYLPNLHSHWHLRRSDPQRKTVSSEKSDDQSDGHAFQGFEDGSTQFEPLHEVLDIPQTQKDFACAVPKRKSSLAGRLADLTERQSEVIKALTPGLSNKEIARELDLSDATVKVHIRNLMKKLEATNRTQLALIGAKSLDSGVVTEI